jgi:hypothetical protein
MAESIPQITNVYSLVTIERDGSDRNIAQECLTFEYTISPQLAAVRIVPQDTLELIYYLNLQVIDMGTANVITFGQREIMSMKLPFMFSGYEFKAPERSYISLKNKMIQADADSTGAVISVSGVAFPPDFDFRRWV